MRQLIPGRPLTAPAISVRLKPIETTGFVLASLCGCNTRSRNAANHKPPKYAGDWVLRAPVSWVAVALCSARVRKINHDSTSLALAMAATAPNSP
jgi:hypothetical protein